MREKREDVLRRAEKARNSRVGGKRNHNPLIALKNAPVNKKLTTLSIKAMCAHCMGCTEEHIADGWKEEVRNCTAPKCPLYNVRPYQKEKVICVV